MTHRITLMINGRGFTVTPEEWDKIKSAGDRALDGVTGRERLSCGELYATVATPNQDAGTVNTNGQDAVHLADY